MSDRIAVMHAGRVEQLGTPEELYERPATRFVADFIGTTNLLHGVDRAPTGRVAPRRSGDVVPGSAHDGVAAGRRRRDQRPPGVDQPASRPTPRAPSAARSSRPPISGPACQYQVRTAGGLSVTVLAPKTGIRLPVGSEVAVAWSPSSTRPRRWAERRRWRRSTHERSIRRLVASTSSARSCATWSSARSAAASCWSGSRGGRGRRARAGHRGVHGQRRESRPPRRARRPPPVPRHRPLRAPAAEPTPVPAPEAELNIYNWTRLHRRRRHRIVRGRSTGVKVNYDLFDDTDEAYAKLGADGGGYDISFPIRVDVPGFIADGRPPRARQVAAPEHRATSARSGPNPGYDPGNKYSRAVHVVDDRRRLRHRPR